MEGSNTLDILKEIIEREQKAKDFYIQAKEKAIHPLCKRIFDILTEEKQRQLSRAHQVYNSFKEGYGWRIDRFLWEPGQCKKNPFENLSEIYNGTIYIWPDDLKLLDLAMKLEKENFTFLDGKEKEAIQPLAKRCYIGLSYATKGYYLMLADVRDYLVNPEDWLSLEEHVLINGV
jgi:hypothetical protein